MNIQTFTISRAANIAVDILAPWGGGYWVRSFTQSVLLALLLSSSYIGNVLGLDLVPGSVRPSNA